jgi:hypothetical protein
MLPTTSHVIDSITSIAEDAKRYERIPLHLQPLTRALLGNAGFSAVTGVSLVLGAVPLSRWLEIPTWLTAAVGVGLLPFSLAVSVVARRPSLRTVRLVIAADLVWVAGAAIVILGFPQSMSTSGLWVLGLVTVAVAGFAVLQAVGLRRMETAA